MHAASVFQQCPGFSTMKVYCLDTCSIITFSAPSLVVRLSAPADARLRLTGLSPMMRGQFVGECLLWSTASRVDNASKIGE